MLVVAVDAWGKCPMEHLRVVGDIHIEGAATPAWRAVLVFPGRQASAGSFIRDKARDHASDAFAVDVTYDTFRSAGFLGDSCSPTPETMDVVVVFDDFGAQRRSLGSDEFVVDASTTPSTLRLPTITVEASGMDH